MIIELLNRKKSRILNKWTQLTLDTYSAESARFLKSEKNQFSNPVGYTITNNLEKIFNEIIGSQNFDLIESSLNEIIKVRAIQEFTPATAVRFVLLLKQVIQDDLKEELKDESVFSEYINFITIVDRLTLMAFNLYVECRERVFRVRVNEIKSNSVRN